MAYFSFEYQCDWVDINVMFKCEKASKREVLRLCRSTLIDSAFIDQINSKSLHIFKANYHFVISWSEDTFDFKNDFNISFVGKVTQLLVEYQPSPDAVFIIDSGPEKGKLSTVLWPNISMISIAGNLVMFSNHRWSMWLFPEYKIVVNKALITEPIIYDDSPPSEVLKLGPLNQMPTMSPIN